MNQRGYNSEIAFLMPPIRYLYSGHGGDVCDDAGYRSEPLVGSPWIQVPLLLLLLAPPHLIPASSSSSYLSTCNLILMQAGSRQYYAKDRDRFCRCDKEQTWCTARCCPADLSWWSYVVFNKWLHGHHFLLPLIYRPFA